MTPKLISANICFLSQGVELLSQMDNTVYSKPVESFYNASVGAHVRHCLDHFDSFVMGLDTGKIDYDKRLRDKSIEASVNTAIARMEGIIEKLNAHSLSIDLGKSIQVKMDCGDVIEDDAENWQLSTIGREFQFLASHTVHHFAMMKRMCNDLGVTTPPDFGIAPSTVKHLQKV